VSTQWLIGYFFIVFIVFSVENLILFLFFEWWRIWELSGHPTRWKIVCLVLCKINDGDPLPEVLFINFPGSGIDKQNIGRR